MGIITLVWVVWGFSLCFGASGRFTYDPSDFAMLNRVNYKNLPHEGGARWAGHVEGIPGLVFAGYQGMFAVITPALMTGAFAERTAPPLPRVCGALRTSSTSRGAVPCPRCWSSTRSERTRIASRAGATGRGPARGSGRGASVILPVGWSCMSRLASRAGHGDGATS